MAASPGESRFLDAVLQNPRVRDVLGRAAALDLPDWYLAAGCLFQTVWNVLDGRDPEHGINDYDLIYHDGSDLSWDAEDVVIRRCAEAFGDLGVEVEVRNQARVHLWYEDHFGVPYAPLRSSAEAVDRYAAHACRVAVRTSSAAPRHGSDHGSDHGYDVYAPSGFDDLFAFVVRPNTVVAPREVYETKSARWARLWPRLTVLPWPVDARPPPAGPPG
ncbi:MAG TPA: nucleotidyltransferase family protein [Acidimicrobiales bacterium]|nr:nucleotidyltransferase family protein [Acidimicrobiales bacterium]